MTSLWHFSEDPTLSEFTPRPGGEAEPGQRLVWAIDAEHAPAYWFPRDCPRITFWQGPESPTDLGRALLVGAVGRRVHAIEADWYERMRTCALWAYEFDPAQFRPWGWADGYHVSERAVRPTSVRPAGDLVARHIEAGIELRILPTLWPLVDAVRDSGLRFSMIRLRNAGPDPRADSAPTAPGAA